MSIDCGVCLYFDGDTAEIFSQKDVRAKKPWKCSECKRPIAVGELHQHCTMFCEGEWSEYRTCSICAEIRKAFSCEGECVGGIFWDEMEGRGGGDALFASMTSGCFDRLTTASAKSYLVERWNAWKGLAEARA